MAFLKRTFLLLAACGVPGGEGGGGEHLPSAGAGPFARPEGEPWLLREAGFHLRDPALAPDGTLYLSRVRRQEGAIAEIAVAEGERSRVLFPGTAPSLVADGDAWLLYYNLGTDVVRAHSSDGGATWTQDGVVLTDALEPGALRVDGTIHLYFARPDHTAIHLATSEDGLVFARVATPVLAASRLADPSPVGGTTPTGRRHVTLFFAQDGQDGWAIAAAGSFDGLTFERFANGEAVLEPEYPDERGPAVRLERDRATLIFASPNGAADAIGVAFDD